MARYVTDTEMSRSASRQDPSDSQPHSTTAKKHTFQQKKHFQNLFIGSADLALSQIDLACFLAYSSASDTGKLVVRS